MIRVLIVDDEPDTLESLKMALGVRSEVDFRIDTASTLSDALIHLHANPTDVVLLDLHLPGAPANEELVRIIRASVPEVSVIAHTGWAEDGIEARVKDAGADGLILKPAAPDEISRRLQHSVIYHNASKERHELERVIDQLGQAIERVAQRHQEDPT